MNHDQKSLWLYIFCLKEVLNKPFENKHHHNLLERVMILSHLFAPEISRAFQFISIQVCIPRFFLKLNRPYQKTVSEKNEQNY